MFDTELAVHKLRMNFFIYHNQSIDIQLTASLRFEFASRDELASTRAEVADLHERIEDLARVSIDDVEQSRDYPQIEGNRGVLRAALPITGTRTTVSGPADKVAEYGQKFDVASPSHDQGITKDLDDCDRYSSAIYSQRQRRYRPPEVSTIMSGLVSNGMSPTKVIGLSADHDSPGRAVSHLTTVIPQDPSLRPLLCTGDTAWKIGHDTSQQKIWVT